MEKQFSMLFLSFSYVFQTFLYFFVNVGVKNPNFGFRVYTRTGLYKTGTHVTVKISMRKPYTLLGE